MSRAFNSALSSLGSAADSYVQTYWVRPMSHHARPSSFREGTSSFFAFVFGVSVLLLVIALWAQATLSDTETLEQAVVEVTESDAIGAPLVEAAVESIVEGSALPEDEIRAAVAQVWDTPEAEALRTQLAEALVSLAVSEDLESESINLTEVAIPLLRQAGQELQSAGFDVSQADVDQLIEELGPTAIVIEADELPIAGRLLSIRTFLAQMISRLGVVAAVAALLAMIFSVEPRRRIRNLVFVVSGMTLLVAGGIWVVGTLAEGVVPDEHLGAALGGIFDANVTPLVVVGVIFGVLGTVVPNNRVRSAGQHVAAQYVDTPLPPAPTDPTKTPARSDAPRHSQQDSTQQTR